MKHMKSPAHLVFLASLLFASACKSSGAAAKEAPQTAPASTATPSDPGTQAAVATAATGEDSADAVDLCGGSGVMSKSLMKTPLEAKVRELWTAAAAAKAKTSTYASSADTARAAKAFAKLKPAAFPHTGKVAGGLAWEEQGEKFAFLMSKAVDTKTNSNSLAGTLFQRSGGKWIVVSEINDGEKNCEFDLIGDFSDVIELSDLDGDGQHEVSFAYTRGCTSDVSPEPLTLITLERSEKHTVRGSTLSIDAACAERSPSSMQLRFQP